MKWLPVLLTGCLWLSEERDGKRLDADADGVPLPVDCNDDRANITGMFATEGAISCGNQIVGEINGGSDTAAPGEDALTNLMGVTNCLHPQYSDLLLEMSSWEHSYRLDVSTPTGVRVTLEPTRWQSSLPRHAVEEHAVLLANRGPLCDRDSCLPGLPLASTGAESDAPTTFTAFTAQPGEPWFLVVSARSGGYTLSVDCDAGVE